MVAPEVEEGLNIVGNGYRQGLSTGGIVFNDESNNPSFFYLYNQFAPFQLPLLEEDGDAARYIACSSSHGLLALWNTTTNRYLIGNPLPPELNEDNEPNTDDPYVTLPPTPRLHTSLNTHVVLATDLAIPAFPVYHLFCAVREEELSNHVVLDVYCSEVGYWKSFPAIDLNGRRIVPNSGVSCGRLPFWLTANPPSIFMFNLMGAYGLVDTYGPAAVFMPMPVAADVLGHPQTRLQLGRENDEKDPRLGLVVVNGKDSRVEHYIFKNSLGELERGSPRFLNIHLRQDQRDNPNNSNAVQVLGYVNNATGTWEIELACTEMPRPVRFESFKMEVLLWVDRRMALWEEHPGTWPLIDSVKILEKMAVWPQVADGFAHIPTKHHPAVFQVYMVDDNGDSDQSGASSDQSGASSDQRGESSDQSSSDQSGATSDQSGGS